MAVLAAVVIVVGLAATTTASAAAVPCGTVITTPGVYTLSSDLLCGGPMAIEVQAQGVTLNLNGHALVGAALEGIGVEVDSESYDTTIENGMIRGFALGINVFAYTHVINMRIARNGVG